MVPSVQRRPLKRRNPDAETLLKFLSRWRGEASRAGHMIGRIAVPRDIQDENGSLECRAEIAASSPYCSLACKTEYFTPAQTLRSQPVS